MTAIPSKATGMSTSPLPSSSGLRSREDEPMSLVPESTASIPADEPSPDTSTHASGCASWNASAACSAMGSSVVDPVTISWSVRRDPFELHPESSAAASSRVSAAGYRRERRDVRSCRSRHGTRSSGRSPPQYRFRAR